MLPLTLAVDGADWAPQFATWRAADWAVLAVTSSCVCIGANWCIQHATWRVGAPVLSMFYVSGRRRFGEAAWERAAPHQQAMHPCAVRRWTCSPAPGANRLTLLATPATSTVDAPMQGLRLVAAIVESKLLLGATVITTGLQVRPCCPWQQERLRLLPQGPGQGPGCCSRGEARSLPPPPVQQPVMPAAVAPARCSHVASLPPPVLAACRLRAWW